MKIPVSVWALFLMLIAGCTNLHEQHLEIYENAVANVNSDTTLQSVTFNLLDAETASVRYLSSLTSEEKLEFESDSLCDIAFEVCTMRDSLFVLADVAYARAGIHFVEKRTVLYENAARFYSSASTLGELEVVRGIVSVYSEKAYVEGERVCDPPKQVRDAYESAKDLSAKNYDEAIGRIGRNPM